jgi:hypothetical protein
MRRRAVAKAIPDVPPRISRDFGELKASLWEGMIVTVSP